MPTNELPKTVTTDHLNCGDVVRIDNIGCFNDAIVQKVEEGRVWLFRPYATNTDWIGTGGVICYTGTEEYFLPRDSKQTVILLQRGSVELMERCRAANTARYEALRALRQCFHADGTLLLDPAKSQMKRVASAKDARGILEAVDAALADVR